MKNLISLFFIVIALSSCAQEGKEFPNQIETNKSEKLKRILGTKVYLQIPEGYQYIKELARYQKADNIYVQVLESNTSSFVKAKPNFTKQAFEAKGAKIDLLKDIKLNQLMEFMLKAHLSIQDKQK